MKRIFAAVLALCLCAAGAAMAQESEDGWAAGDTVVFGSYEQDNVLTNGKEPLEWIVLKTEGDRAMLITRYLIDARAYHKAFVKMTWSECTLRQWLNDTFLKEAFSQEEQARIEEVLVVNDDNPHYSTRGGEDTMDRVFLLSEAEVLEFFPEQEQRTCQATEYAKAQGAYVDENNGNSWWWLRSPGVRPVDACGVRADGRIIRNRLKIAAAPLNARAFLQIQREFGSFDRWLWAHTGGRTLRETGLARSPLSDGISRELKARGMKFVGSTIIYAFLQAAGVIDSHEPGCFLAGES